MTIQEFIGQTFPTIQVNAETLLRAEVGGTAIHFHKKERNKRNNDSGANRKEDEIKGKIGEEGLRSILVEARQNISLPTVDYELREGKYLTWTSDLGKLNIKSCNSEYDQFEKPDKFNKLGPSWIINPKELTDTYPKEIGDSGRTERAFIMEDECVVVLMIIDLTGSCKVYGWTTYGELRDLLNRGLFTRTYADFAHKRAFFLVDLVEQGLIHDLDKLRDDQII